MREPLAARPLTALAGAKRVWAAKTREAKRLKRKESEQVKALRRAIKALRKTRRKRWEAEAMAKVGEARMQAATRAWGERRE